MAAEGAILKATRIGYQGLLQALDTASRTLPRGLSQVGGEPTSIIAELTRSSQCESNGWQYLAAPRVQAPLLIGGRWLTTDRQKGKAFREHFAAAGSTSEAVAQRLATAAARLDTALDVSTGGVPPITTWEAEQVVHVTRRTAPGPDGILIEMLAGTVLRVAVGAMNDALLCGRVPDGWCLVDVVPVAKGGRGPHNSGGLPTSWALFGRLQVVRRDHGLEAGAVGHFDVLRRPVTHTVRGVSVEDAIFALHSTIMARIEETSRRDGRGPDYKGAHDCSRCNAGGGRQGCVCRILPRRHARDDACRRSSGAVYSNLAHCPR